MIRYDSIQYPDEILAFLPEPRAVIYAEMDEIAVTTSNSPAPVLYTNNVVNCTGIGLTFNCKGSNVRGGALMHLKTSHMHAEYTQSTLKERVQMAWHQMWQQISGIIDHNNPNMYGVLEGGKISRAAMPPSGLTPSLRADAFDQWRQLEIGHIECANALIANEHAKIGETQRKNRYRKIYKNFEDNHADVIKRVQTPQMMACIAALSNEALTTTTDELDRIMRRDPITRNANIIDLRETNSPPASLIVDTRDEGLGAFQILTEMGSTIVFNALTAKQWNAAEPINQPSRDAALNRSKRILHQLVHKYEAL